MFQLLFKDHQKLLALLWLQALHMLNTMCHITFYNLQLF